MSDRVEDQVLVELDENEWLDITQRLRPAIGGDEHDPLGKVALLIGDGRRRWMTFDERHLMVLDAGEAQGDCFELVSPRLLDAWRGVSAGSGSAVLSRRFGPEKVQLVLSGPGGSAAVDVPYQEYPAVLEIADRQRANEVASVQVDSDSLLAAANLTHRRPRGIDDEAPNPYTWLEFDGSTMAVVRWWDGLGETRFELPAEGEADCKVPVALEDLGPMIASFGEGPVEVGIPRDAFSTLRIEQGDLAAFFMPLDPDKPGRDRVIDVLVEVFGDDVVHTDEHGDFQLGLFGVPVYARYTSGSPSFLTIFANVLYDVAETPELLAELNKLNGNARPAKVVLADGVVTVCGSLVAATIDAPEVAALVGEVRDVADGLGPTLAAYFGGSTGRSVEDERWEGYLAAEIAAEVAPGRWEVLHGPDSVEDLPIFDEPMYVITAFNPHGRVREHWQNEQENARLAGQLLAAGAALSRAVGGAIGGHVPGAAEAPSDTTVAEASFLVWGVDEEVVAQAARDFGQEAYFVLEDEEVSVVGAFSERTETILRRG